MAVQLNQLVQPEPLPYQWWYAYGYFSPGEDGFPHIGQVIRHYREMSNMDIETFALKLGVSPRRAYELEESSAMPKSIPRRQALADILSIPAALLNLPVLLQPFAVHPVAGTSILAQDAMQTYEDVLDLAWGAYYTSNPQRSARTVLYWQQYLANRIQESSGVSRDQMIALYCRFSQLGCVIARDRLDVNSALAHADQAVSAAFQLKNAELIASALYRRAKIYIGQRQYAQAVADVEGAIPYAERSRAPLRAYVSVFLAEVYSLHAPGDKQLRKKSLTLLDEVGRAVRSKGVLEGDGSYAKVDLPGLYIIRGDVLRRQGDIEGAQNALLVVADHLPPEFTRWRGNLRISEAQLSFVDHDYEGSSQLALEALNIVDATRSQSNRAKIERLYEDLSGAAPKHALVRELGERLGLR